MSHYLIHAQTNPGGNYPGYINFTRNADGTVRVIVRGDPKEVEGVRVCGRTCRPGGEHCNNYCNMHPRRKELNLPMPDSPLPHTFTVCGEAVELTLSAEAFEKLKRGLENGR